MAGVPVVSELVHKHCKSCKAGAGALEPNEISELIGGLHGWQSEGGQIVKTFKFENYYQTMAFVNAVAWISHQEDHHPDLEVGYNKCVVKYSSHEVNGLSENDFICAAKVEALMGLGEGTK